MRTILLLILLISFSSFSQINTEVYLFDVTTKGNQTELTNKRNISNNDGYDNQPSFFNKNTVLFSSTRNGQTDIAVYDIKDSKLNWLTNTPEGSEYSPTRIPKEMAVSSIRLDKSGLQRLYKYDYKTGKPITLLKDLKVGYHCWYNQNIIISSVLEKEALSLVVSNIKDNTNYTFQKKVGRSLHKIPGTQLIGYISKENEVWEIKSLNPISGATKKIITAVPGAEDMCWLPNGTILMGKENEVFKFNPETDTEWSVFYSFTNQDLKNISRIATSSTGKLLAIVFESK